MMVQIMVGMMGWMVASNNVLLEATQVLVMQQLCSQIFSANTLYKIMKYTVFVLKVV